MHPAATRRLDYDPHAPAEDCKDRILTQWGDHIEEFHRVAATSPDGNADMGGAFYCGPLVSTSSCTSKKRS